MSKYIIYQRLDNIKLVKTIYNEPSPGSLGDYWLLIEKYKTNYPNWKYKSPEKWRRTIFNEYFSRFMLSRFNELNCEYCGKENLKIYKWHEKKDESIMCTVDHFLPKKDYPLLKEDPSNLFICCYNCNNKKGSKYYNESTIKYRYDDNIRKEFKFNTELL